ncbi:hypothetical protein F4680DRAFT_117067 [Xylaria scruposa]|nr:hypothetical protein F4680DRAFT_117067 [Xylaria scruposa]
MCDIAGTRYGYIMSEENFVACCFHKPVAKPAGPATRPIKQAAGSPKLNVALMPVPWAQHGEEQLTTGLALWWISMLALLDFHYRALVPKADMVGINEWEPAFLDEERGWVYRYRYSKWEERTSELPPAYRAPSPGNQAAFEAAVGINMDPDFELYDAGVVDSSFFGHHYPLDELDVAEDIADVYAANSPREGDA